MNRAYPLCVLAAVSIATTTHAQTFEPAAAARVMTSHGVLTLAPSAELPSALTDFRLHSYIDEPKALTVVSRQKPLIIQGWAFECRSGLQPSTQRVGDVGVSFDDPVRGVENYLPDSVRATNGRRPDVQIPFAGSCPAVGGSTGYALEVQGLPPRGVWTIKLLWATYDGAGRIIFNIDKRTIIFVD